MTRKERTIYAIIIFLQFSLIVYSFIINQQTKRELRKSLKSENICSFWGLNENGEKRLIHFTGYSGKSYIFVTLSKDCPHCEQYIADFNKFGDLVSTKENVELVVLVTDRTQAITESNASFTVLLISHEDMYQFGSATPTTLIVNSKGEIHSKYIGYHPDVYRKAWEDIENLIVKKSKIIN